MIWKMTCYVNSIWNQWDECHFETMSQPSGEDKLYLYAGCMIVDRATLKLTESKQPTRTS